MVDARDWGRRGCGGKWKLFNGYKVSVCANKKGLEIENGDGSIKMGIYLMPLVVNFKMVKMENVRGA